LIIDGRDEGRDVEKVKRYLLRHKKEKMNLFLFITFFILTCVFGMFLLLKNGDNSFLFLTLVVTIFALLILLLGLFAFQFESPIFSSHYLLGIIIIVELVWFLIAFMASWKINFFIILTFQQFGAISVAYSLSTREKTYLLREISFNDLLKHQNVWDIGHPKLLKEIKKSIDLAAKWLEKKLKTETKEIGKVKLKDLANGFFAMQNYAQISQGNRNNQFYTSSRTILTAVNSLKKRLEVSILNDFFLLDLAMSTKLLASLGELSEKARKRCLTRLIHSAIEISDWEVYKLIINGKKSPPLPEIVEALSQITRKEEITPYILKCKMILNFIETRAFDRLASFSSFDKVKINLEDIAKILNTVSKIIPLDENIDLWYNFFEKFQNSIGSWNNSVYTTALCVETLINNGLKTRQNPVLKGLIFLLATQNRDGSWNHNIKDTSSAIKSLFSALKIN